MFCSACDTNTLYATRIMTSNCIYRKQMIGARHVDDIEARSERIKSCLRATSHIALLYMDAAITDRKVGWMQRVRLQVRCPSAPVAEAR